MERVSPRLPLVAKFKGKCLPGATEDLVIGTFKQHYEAIVLLYEEYGNGYYDLLVAFHSSRGVVELEQRTFEGLFIERMASSATSTVGIEFAPKWDSNWDSFNQRLAEQCSRLQARVTALEEEAEAAWHRQRAVMEQERTEMEERYREETEAQTQKLAAKIKSREDQLTSMGREHKANLRRENRNREAYELRIAALESENARLKKETTAFRLVLRKREEEELDRAQTRKKDITPP